MEILAPGAGFRTTRSWTRWPGRWLVLSLAIVAAAAPAESPSGTTPEYRIKAVFLFNFAQFVEWPPEAFSSPEAPLVIGVLGDDPFGSALDETVRDEKVGSRPLLVRRYKRAEEIAACHILFISRSEDAHLEESAARLRDRSILTVSDSEGAARRGIMVRFFNENRKIRLRINLDAARAAGLTISSKLLRPAVIVTGEGN